MIVHLDDLARIPYFAGIQRDGLRRIDRAAHRHSYQAGATIFVEGGECAGFHVVTEGLVRIYRVNSEGRLHTLSLLRPLSTFNEVAAVDGGPNPYNAVAVTVAEVLTISHDQLMALMSAEPALLSNYVQSLARVNRDYIERLEDMTFRTIPSRLAKLFLHERNTYAGQISEAPTGLTQEDIASILGTTREVVGRALRGLLNAGLLVKKGRHMYIADRAGLQCLAETNTMPKPVRNVPSSRV
ncbi:MAG: Crp/Fnr family transcriptional regulator [Aggregatilineales bacterium]